MSGSQRMNARQLGLDLPISTSFGREDFLVAPSNAAAFARFEAWPAWADRVLLLLGPTGSGKSHLAAIWAADAGATTISAEALSLDRLPQLAAAPALVVEDADRIGPREAELFHLLNLVRGEAADGSVPWLVLTARSWPDSWGLSTRDLLSRLRLAPAVEIDEPGDDLVRAVLVKLFQDRQLAVDTSVVDYLALRIDRSLGAARSIVEAIDREALARGRAVTRPIAAEVLRDLEGS